MVTPDHGDEWEDVLSPPRPVISTPVSRTGKALPNSDGTIALWLPSNIPTRLHSRSCVDGLITKEIVLWVADCSDSLHNIRRCLRELSAFSSFKRKTFNGPGQKIQTRALATLKALRNKRDCYVTRYRRSHAAWLILDPGQTHQGGEWKDVLRALKKNDLTFPGDDEELDYAFDSDGNSENEATTSTAPTKQGADVMSSNTKKR